MRLGPPGERSREEQGRRRREEEEEVNNVGTERGLIAPRRGCAIYLQLSGSAAVSFVTLVQMRVYVGVLGISVSR